MNIWIVSDTHFNHENIKLYEHRPHDYQDQIISNWNKLVQHDDLVIHLGDVIMGSGAGEKLASIMATLPGKKILCRGNHDVEKKWGTGIGFMERGFDAVVDYFVYDLYAFSHVPLTPLPRMGNIVPEKAIPNEVTLNIHGHFHRKDPVDAGGNFQPGFYDPKYFWENREKYYNVSRDFENELRPFSLEEVLGRWMKRGGETKNGKTTTEY